MKWYRFNVEAYQIDTYGMPDAEDLAYRRLLDLYYLDEGPLLNDDAELVRRVGLDWDCIIPVLLKFFVLNEAGSHWVHLECQVDIAQRLARSEWMRRVGKSNRKKALPDTEQQV